MRYDLDFHRPQRSVFITPRWLRALLFVLLVAALALMLRDVFDQFSQREHLQQRLAALRLHTDRVNDAKPASPQALRAQQAESLARVQLATPWESIFSALERCRTGSISLLNLSADQSTRDLVLKGQARTIGGVKVFVEGLAQEKVFEQVVLSSHSPLQAASGAVLFEVRAKWR